MSTVIQIVKQQKPTLALLTSKSLAYHPSTPLLHFPSPLQDLAFVSHLQPAKWQWGFQRMSRSDVCWMLVCKTLKEEESVGKRVIDASYKELEQLPKDDLKL